MAALILGLIFAPHAIIVAAQIILTALFRGWTAMRIVGAWTHHLPPPAARSDDRLPSYTVVAALHREARALPGLVAALKALDYPRERLQIMLALEHDDFETQFAAEFLHLDSSFEIVIVPAAGPRTKPKALNAALAFARGCHTVVYDAEDRPEPDQLRRAVDVFCTAGPKVVCVQAALTIDNTRDGWLPRLFTVEYASQFDVLLPGFASLKLPILLGGSSNHFHGIR
jgi:cellulose synthase/poly-beta-1,6-N-acetylglucosamine synthase-like glycosyltransferase